MAGENKKVVNSEKDVLQAEVAVENTAKTVEPAAEKSETPTKVDADKSGKYPLMGGFLERFLAVFIDGFVITGAIICVYIVYFILLFLLSAIGGDSGGGFVAAMVGLLTFMLMLSYFGVIFGYYIYFYTKNGQTIGKKVMKLKVVRTESLAYMTWGRVLLREIIGKWVSSWLFGLGYFWYFMSDKRQAWQDSIADTYVVQTDDKGEILMTGPEKYEKKALFTFGPIGCFFTLWLVIVIMAVSTGLLVGMTAKNQYDNYDGGLYDDFDYEYDYEYDSDYDDYDYYDDSDYDADYDTDEYYDMLRDLEGMNEEDFEAELYKRLEGMIPCDATVPATASCGAGFICELNDSPYIEDGFGVCVRN